VAFATHHGVEIKACQAGDAKRKGKIERPFRGLEESFLEEQAVLGPPASVAELNDRARRWLAERVNGRIHSTTGATPVSRLETERRLLAPLPRRRFDTAYAEPRRVHVALPLIEWDTVRYSVPSECLGQVVACRVEVDSDQLEISWGGQLVAAHVLAPAGSDDVWDPAHRAAAEAAALGRTRPPLRLVPSPAPPSPAASERLEVGDGYDVEIPDLACYGLDGEGA
jgi:hypothetical protein